MKKVNYSLLSAVGYAAAIEHEPKLARASTVRRIKKMSKDGTLHDVAERSRLFKAATFLKDKGFQVNLGLSTIRRVIMESSDGIQAIATNRGEALINGKLVERYTNG